MNFCAGLKWRATSPRLAQFGGILRQDVRTIPVPISWRRSFCFGTKANRFNGLNHVFSDYIAHQIPSYRRRYNSTFTSTSTFSDTGGIFSRYSKQLVALAVGIGVLGITGYFYFIKDRACAKGLTFLDVEEVDENANLNEELHQICDADGYCPENVWYFTHHFQVPLPLMPYAMSSNMTIVKLHEHGQDVLLIYCPTKLTERAKQQLASLKAPVKHIVVGNQEHNLFFPQYLEAFPQAQCYCSQEALPAVMKAIRRDYGDRSDQLLVNVVPLDGKVVIHPDIAYKTIRGIPTLNEVVLYHRPSKLLFVADTATNMKPDTIKLKNKGESSFYGSCRKFHHNGPEVAVIFGMLIKDPEETMDSVKEITKWDIQGFSMCHGTPLMMKGIKFRWRENVFKAT